MSREKSPPLASQEPERSGVIGSAERRCAACGGPLPARKREACSDACRAALSRMRRAAAERKRKAETRALLEAALEKLREDP
jgi:predicted nucleic acid-binding Zn ribbon protein